MLAPVLALALQSAPPQQNPGAALEGLFLVGGITYGLVTSKRRWMTLLWIVGFATVVLSAAGLMAYLYPGSAGFYGTLGGIAIGLGCPSVAIVHARNSKPLGLAK